MRGLMGDGPIVDGCDYPFSEEGCQVLPTQVSFGLLALGVSPKGHDVFCHGTLLELVFDRLLRVWTGGFKKFLKVLIWLWHLALEITLGGHDTLFVGAIRFLVVIVAAGSSHDLLGVPLLFLSTVFGAFLSTFAIGFGRCPPPPRPVLRTIFPSP
jgi:hypothetical protein